MDAIASQKYTFILFGGAMGGGKTVWGLSALLIMCQIFPKSRWCVIRENTEKLRVTTIPSFKKLKFSGKLRENPFEYTHPNGSVILFKGENYANDKDLDWMKGLEVNGILFEEINECTKDCLDIAFGRVGRWECTPRPKPLIIATCNPTTNWVKSTIYDKHQEGSLPPGWLYIQSKVSDNPFLTKEYIENLKNMPRHKYEAFVEGNWNITLKVGGEFYKCFELEEHVRDVKYNPELPLHISWDDNVNPYLPCGIFQIYVNRNKAGAIESKELVMIDEIAGESPNNKINRVCAEFKRRYHAHKSGLFIYGDATAQKEDTKTEKGHNFFRLVMDELKAYRPTLRVPSANPSVVMRGNWINTVFEKELYSLRFTIGSNCKRAIEDFIKLKEDENGTKKKEMDVNTVTGVRFQKYGHFTDLFDYVACTAFGAEFARFQAGDLSASITTGKNPKSKNSY